MPSAGAADALRGLDPPPVTWDLIAALLKARKNTAFRVEIPIRVLGGLGEGYRVLVTLALAQLWQRGGDPVIRRAIVEAALSDGAGVVGLIRDGRQGLMG